MLRHSPLVSTTYGCAMGALLLLIPAIVLDPGFASLAGVGWPSAAAVFYLAVFASVLGFLWWNHGVSVIGAVKASVFINLIPVSTMLISLIFHEPVTLAQITGCALIIGGVTLAGHKGKEDMPLENATAATKTEAGENFQHKLP